jgi:putative acetyltransferase
MGAGALTGKGGKRRGGVGIVDCGPPDVARVRRLLEDYWASFGFSADFQHFGDELASLPGRYAPPGGCLLIAAIAGEDAGCIAPRRIDAEAVEAKRLYVRPGFRGHGVGAALLERLIAEARRLGYRRILADTMPPMETALALYAKRGFTVRGPYGRDPTPGAIYMELDLREGGAPPQESPDARRGSRAPVVEPE